MDHMDKRFTWTSVILPDPNRPDIPRLVLRRVPVPAQSRRSSPESTTWSHPNTHLASPSNSSTTYSPNCFSSASTSSSSSSSSSSKTKPLLTPNRPVPQWVKNLQSIIMSRNRRCGIEGSKRLAEMSDESKKLTEEQTQHLI